MEGNCLAWTRTWMKIEHGILLPWLVSWHEYLQKTFPDSESTQQWCLVLRRMLSTGANM
jgi:hypothetical protein